MKLTTKHLNYSSKTMRNLIAEMMKKVNKSLTKFLKKAEQKKSEELQIELVFSYPPESHHAELIVRVAHLLALYSSDEKNWNT